MQHAKTKSKQLSSQRTMIWIVGIVAVAIIVLIALIYLFQPKPSVAAYCQAYKEEKARLAKLPGDTYASAVFNDQISDAGEFAKSFSRLEQVAPDDIKPDVKTLQSIYKKIADDPSQALTAGISGIGADHNVQNWTENHCQ